MRVVTLLRGMELNRDAVVEWSVQEPDKFVCIGSADVGLCLVRLQISIKSGAGVLRLLCFSVIHVLTSVSDSCLAAWNSLDSVVDFAARECLDL